MPVELVFVAGLHERRDEREPFVDEPRDVSVPVVVVADSVADSRALLVFDADRDVLGRQNVYVCERHEIVVVVAYDAVDDFIRVEGARRDEHGNRGLRDELGCYDVCVEAVVVELERIDGLRVGILVNTADGDRGDP